MAEERSTKKQKTVMTGEEMEALALENFKKGVQTFSYWSVVDAQSSFKEWCDEYYSPESEAVGLKDIIIYGKITLHIRKVSETDPEEDEETEYSTTIGKDEKPTSLMNFQTALLNFTEPLAEEGLVGGNIYDLKRISSDTYHLIMGD